MIILIEWTKKKLLLYLSDINNFKLFFKDKFTNKSPKFHQEMHEFLFKNHRICGIAAPRGRGKTTGVTFLQVIFRIAYRMENFIVVLSQNKKKASEFISSVRSEIKNNEELRRLYNLQLYKNISREGTDTQYKIDIYAGNQVITLQAIGFGQDVRGLVNFQNNRPTLVIGDDYEGEKVRKYKNARESVKDAVQAVVLPALEPAKDNRYKQGKFWLIGTIVHEDSLLNEYINDENIPSLLYKGIQNGKSIWPERFPIKQILKERKMAKKRNRIGLWQAEIMNEPIADELKCFDKKDIRTFNTSLIMNSLHRFQIVTAIDYAQTYSSTSDYTVISTVAIERDTGNWYVLRMDYLKEPVNVIIDRIFDNWEQFNANGLDKGVYIEENNAGATLIQLLNSERMQRNYYFAVHNINPNKFRNSTKVYKIRDYLQNRFKDGKIHFPDNAGRWFDLFMNEYNNFVADEKKDNKHDDGLDTLATIAFVENKYNLVNKGSSRIHRGSGYSDEDIENIKKISFMDYYMKDKLNDKKKRRNSFEKIYN